jgi:hypothetical protein
VITVANTGVVPTACVGTTLEKVSHYLEVRLADSGKAPLTIAEIGGCIAMISR